jgi:2-polyprenyl-3-methyl-5-hydroxy-6-metoxy-1,4-benzoquinol methylase
VIPQTETTPHKTVERLSPATDDYIEILYHWQRYLMTGHLVEGKQVLDAACGEGYGAEYLARFATRVCAVDVDGQTIKAAQTKYRRAHLHFQQGSIHQLPFAAETFDIATSFETIEHLPAEQQESFLGELMRVLKPGGLLLISTPNRRRTERFAEKNPHHLREFYLEEFTGFLKKYFKHVHCWFQELNLASFVWDPNGRSPMNVGSNRTEWSDGAYQASDGAMSDFLYVIAACSNDQGRSSADLHSVCFDVTRRPLESLWHDYLTQIDGLKTQIDGLKRVAEDAREELRIGKSSIQDLETSVKQLRTALAVSRFESQTIARSASEREAMIATLRDELTRIQSSQSWKLVERYRQIVDGLPFGGILRPIRDRIFKRRRPS